MAATRIGVLTSGGDASGMNAALRAIVRTGLDNGFEVYAIFEGYRGLIEGGDKIRPLGWPDVGGIIHRGGTFIGSARSEEFRTREGRSRAAMNMLLRGIDGLVVTRTSNCHRAQDGLSRSRSRYCKRISGSWRVRNPYL